MWAEFNWPGVILVAAGVALFLLYRWWVKNDPC